MSIKTKFHLKIKKFVTNFEKSVLRVPLGVTLQTKFWILYHVTLGLKNGTMIENLFRFNVKMVFRTWDYPSNVPHEGKTVEYSIKYVNKN